MDLEDLYQSKWGSDGDLPLFLRPAFVPQEQSFPIQTIKMNSWERSPSILSGI